MRLVALGLGVALAGCTSTAAELSYEVSPSEIILGPVRPAERIAAFTFDVYVLNEGLLSFTVSNPLFTDGLGGYLRSQQEAEVAPQEAQRLRILPPPADDGLPTNAWTTGTFEGNLEATIAATTLVGDTPQQITEDLVIPVSITIDCDFDLDGVDGAQCGGSDCDDSEDDVFPGATEVCDGIDNDCDGLADENC